MPTCKRCDQSVKYEEEHYNDGINEDGDVVWEIAGWVCTEKDWRGMFKDAELELRMLKKAVIAMHALVDQTSPNDPVGVALTKVGLQYPPGDPDDI
jgi:hypothetical protein